MLPLSDNHTAIIARSQGEKELISRCENAVRGTSNARKKSNRVKKVIRFNGKQWMLMDPTFAACRPRSTDLSQIPALTPAFDAMAAEMKGFTAVTEKPQPLTQPIVKAENDGGNNGSEGYTNMADRSGELDQYAALSATSDDDCFFDGLGGQILGEPVRNLPQYARYKQKTAQKGGF